MAANIGEIRNGVSARIKDTAAILTITPDLTCDVDRAITSAREEYQKTRPRERAALVNGSGAGAFNFALEGASAILTGYDGELSSILEIWYPYVVTDQEPARLPDEEWTVVRLDTGLVLRFLRAKPTSAEQFLAVYTTAHTLDASTSTIPASDDEALKDLAAAYACLMLAGHYAQATRNTIDVDSVNRPTEVDKYKGLASAYRKAYEQKIGGAGTAAGPGMAIAEVDRGYPTGADRLFHGKDAF